MERSEKITLLIRNLVEKYTNTNTNTNSNSSNSRNNKTDELVEYALRILGSQLTPTVKDPFQLSDLIKRQGFFVFFSFKFLNYNKPKNKFLIKKKIENFIISD